MRGLVLPVRDWPNETGMAVGATQRGEGREGCERMEMLYPGLGICFAFVFRYDGETPLSLQVWLVRLEPAQPLAEKKKHKNP